MEYYCGFNPVQLYSADGPPTGAVTAQKTAQARRHPPRMPA